MYINPFQKLPKRKFSWISNFCLALVIFFIFGTTSYAQCAMCRASLASEGNKTKAEAVNDGIVYLMVIPYLLVGGIGYAIYRMKKK
ncbi:MAG: hypothetical protein RLZZ236_831 [Bacteroidota bacterium]|mgnify:FL=1|jgi:hypothetical protein